MRPRGANYENQCSSKWVAHGGGLRGTCEEEPGLQVPPKPRTASSNARLWLCPSGPQTCRQVTHKHTLILEVDESPPPPPKYPNGPSDVDRRQMRKSQRGGAAGACTQHCKHRTDLWEPESGDMREDFTAQGGFWLTDIFIMATG